MLYCSLYVCCVIALPNVKEQAYETCIGGDGVKEPLDFYKLFQNIVNDDSLLKIIIFHTFQSALLEGV